LIASSERNVPKTNLNTLLHSKVPLMTDQATSAHPDHHEEHGFSHPQPVSMLLGVFVALVLLTIITVLQSNFSLGNWEIWLSLFIATIKASLVMYFFMHLGWEKPFNVIVFLSSVFFLTLFLGLTMMDRDGYRETLEPEIDEPYVLEVSAEPESVEVTE